MNYQTQMQMLKLFLEDKIRTCNGVMLARRNRNLKHDIRIYSEILVMLRDCKHMIEK
jgi:hypothetical protein